MYATNLDHSNIKTILHFIIQLFKKHTSSSCFIFHCNFYFRYTWKGHRFREISKIATGKKLLENLQSCNLLCLVWKLNQWKLELIPLFKNCRNRTIWCHCSGVVNLNIKNDSYRQVSYYPHVYEPHIMFF